MDISLTLNTRKIQKALRLTEKQLATLQKRAAKKTAVNVRAIASKGNLGIDGLRRKKVPRARVKPINKADEIGIWFGLNDIRASEFRERPKKVAGGVQFQGKFYKDHFIARFQYDPRSVKRIFKSTKGGAKWVEVLIPIEREAMEFIRTEIEPIIGDLFAKNFGQAVDSIPHVKVVR